MPNINDIRIRDPFILTDKEKGCYYMYGTTALEKGSLAARNTFTVYKSYDLVNFDEGKVVVDGAKLGFWADRDFWLLRYTSTTENIIFSEVATQRANAALRRYTFVTLQTEISFPFPPMQELPKTGYALTERFTLRTESPIWYSPASGYRCTTVRCGQWSFLPTLPTE